LDEILGSGSYGTVRKCRNKETEGVFACKTIAKENVDNIQMLQREIAIMKEVRHPHIIQLEDVYEDEDHIHLVTELCTGGELYDRVIDKAEAADGTGHFSELDAAHIIHDILDAIAYCHDEKHIVHRDLKPENFLLKDKSDQSAVKIIDFGLSRRDDDSPFGVMRSRVGTYRTMQYNVIHPWLQLFSLMFEGFVRDLSVSLSVNSLSFCFVAYIVKFIFVFPCRAGLSLLFCVPFFCVPFFCGFLGWICSFF
jgi:serine/threonine protein kinase